MLPLNEIANSQFSVATTEIGEQLVTLGRDEDTINVGNPTVSNTASPRALHCTDLVGEGSGYHL